MSKTPRIDKLDRNLLINGNFDFWQRGTSTTTSSEYLADRWLSTAGVTAYDRLTGGPNANSQYFARIGGSSGDVQLIQRVESNFARSTVQDKITLAFHAKANAGTPDINVIVDTPNTIDDYAATTNVSSSNLGALTSSWQKFVVVIDVNSTMRSNGFQVRIGGASISSAVEIDLAQIVILEGEFDDVDFALAGRNITDELRLCQRYYEKTYEIDVAPGTLTGTNLVGTVVDATGVRAQAIWSFKIEKRVLPTITTFSPDAATSNFTSNPSAPVYQGVLYSSTSSATLISTIGNTSSTNGYGIHATADAEL